MRMLRADNDDWLEILTQIHSKAGVNLSCRCNNVKLGHCS